MTDAEILVHLTRGEASAHTSPERVREAMRMARADERRETRAVMDGIARAVESRPDHAWSVAEVAALVRGAVG